MTEASSRLRVALEGRYRLDRELGAGGMATVYLAHDLKHDRDVAIKVLHPDLGAALGGERFLSEIRTTARLQHPHILPLLDSGEADGLLYYVMPLVTGETLRARLERERQLPIADAGVISSTSPPICSLNTANSGPNSPSLKYQRLEAMSSSRMGRVMVVPPPVRRTGTGSVKGVVIGARPWRVHGEGAILSRRHGATRSCFFPHDKATSERSTRRAVARWPRPAACIHQAHA